MALSFPGRVAPIGARDLPLEAMAEPFIVKFDVGDITADHASSCA
jgi:hypothetical protein